jgi:hypothetical protein
MHVLNIAASGNGSAVVIASRQRSEHLGVRIPVGARYILFSKTSRPLFSEYLRLVLRLISEATRPLLLNALLAWTGENYSKWYMYVPLEFRRLLLGLCLCWKTVISAT